VTGRPLELTRAQILSFRRSVGALDERLPLNANSIRRAAWAGLQDSMPRAALLSLHARLQDVGPSAWEHRSLVQIWGPRWSAYVVAARDAAVFTRGRMPDDEASRHRSEELASRVDAHLGGRTISFGAVARPLRLPHHNYVRYATVTGRLRIRWEGARQPLLWTVPSPKLDYGAARLELARRYLHVFGIGTPASFDSWAGVRPASAQSAFDGLAGSLTPVRTPIGDAWILSSDEAAMRAAAERSTPARLLPSGDTYFLLQGKDRELLVPEPKRRGRLWTSRVWPGAVLLGDEVVGTWRRSGTLVAIEVWRRLTRTERDAVGQEALSLPLPDGPARIRWER
jgi:winged helix DNA-binding protein